MSRGSAATAARERPSTALHGLARGSIFTLGGLVAQAVFTFALAVVVTRGLHARGAGVFFQAVALFSILAAVSEFGSGAGLVRTLPRLITLDRPGELRPVVRAALWPVVGVASLAALVLLLIAPVASRVLDLGPQGPAFLRLLAPFLPVAAATTVLLAVTRAFQTMVPYVMVENLGKPALRPLLAAAAIAIGFGPFVVTLTWALPIALLFPVALVASVRGMRRVVGATPPYERGSARAKAGEFWRFAAPRGLAATFQTTTTWLDVLLIGSMRTAAEAGIYGAVGRLSTIGVFAIEAVRLAIAPSISAMLARDDREGAQELYRVGTWWLVALSWPVYVTLAVFAPLVLSLFGQEFVAGQHALLVLSLAMLVSVGTGNVTVMLLMGGKSVWNLGNTLVALTVNVVLNLILIPRFGMVGAALAWTVSITINNLVPLVQVGRLLHVSPFGRGFGIVTGSALGTYGVIGLLARTVLGPSVPALALSVIAATAIYITLLYRFRRALHLWVFREVIGGFVARMRRERADRP